MKSLNINLVFLFAVAVAVTMPGCFSCGEKVVCDSGALVITHDPGRGETHLEWQTDGKSYHSIYRYYKPLNEKNLNAATLLASRLPPTEKSLTVYATGGGDAYYAVVSSNQSGRNAKVTAASTSPVLERDILPPEPLAITGGYKDELPELAWKAPPVKNAENIRSYKVYRSSLAEDGPAGNAECIAQVKPSFGPKVVFVDRHPLVFASYRVSALDSSGNESALSNPFIAKLLADPSISPEDSVATNPDLTVSVMYPLLGQVVEFEAVVRNRGAKAASVPVRVTDGAGNTLLSTCLSDLKPGTFQSVKWSSKFDTAGEHRITVSIDPDNTVREILKSNNEVTFKVNALSRPLYFIWYGNVKDLKYANSGQCTVADLNEWKRRGALAAFAVGAVSETPGALLADYRRYAGCGFNALFIDEVMAENDEARRLEAVLPDLRREYPSLFIGVWNIGDSVGDGIVKLVKDGVIDLLLLEIYIKPGEDIGRLDQAVEKMRSLGIAEHVLIGLVTEKGWSNGVDAQVYAEHVVEEMKFLRKNAPEIPGVAFWSSDTLPGMRDTIDRACYDIYIKNDHLEKEMK